MDIRAEPPRQNILRLPSMYIGHPQWDSAALHTLVGYVFDLALDPRRLNACTALTVKLEKTGIISISDNGRGMPIPDQNNRQRSFIDVLTWYAKTGADISQAYHELYGFLDYMGLVLSCVSESLKITTVWNEVLYSVSCSRGEITLPLREIAKTRERNSHCLFAGQRSVL